MPDLKSKQHDILPDKQLQFLKLQLILFNCLLNHKFPSWSPKESKTKNTLCGFPGGPVVKNLPANAGDTGAIPALGRFHVPWGRACTLQQGKPPQWEAHTLQQRVDPIHSN